ncbi:DUF4435 domain-containing protein [Thiothrix subterranea]|uniref:DUF4435 domain-containing protein n=1 Tax=Thiothrix subterranea TaxID=2735563 RepID=A0AA51QVV2_9GAMM|nr:DUF4435 domain-containing protein [Thiothrix subterranea]MDQ5768102.1 DUF4435 domain-containing protein [Thiothrix subterranea]WML85283.1 DUF4435 domain-containing protein [Thiothrix subterranea]
MSNIEYSSDAINVLNKFHRCSILVYVEGEDDVMFWDIIFRFFEFENYKIEPKDGCEELDKYANRVINEDLNIIIARDADYRVITDRHLSHRNIVTTYGYSIENTLYFPKSLIEVTQIWVKDSDFNGIELYRWLDNLTVKLRSLIVLDIANFAFDLYENILGDNCTKYMSSQHSIDVNDSRIKRAYDEKIMNFTPEQIERIESLIERNDRELHEIIRGHFLQSAILKFISKAMSAKGRKGKISYDALYAHAIQQFKYIFNEHHPHYEYYKQEIAELRK